MNTRLIGLGPRGSTGANELVVGRIRNSRCGISIRLMLVTTKFLNDRGCMAGTFNIRAGTEAGITATRNSRGAGIRGMFIANSVREKRSLII